MNVSRLIGVFFLIWGCSNELNSDKYEIDFKIVESKIDKVQLDSLKKELLDQMDSIIFEDSIYIVRNTCHGEWGGSIWFNNKNTDIEYSCSATCPITVNKMDGNYIVSTTLAHGNGFTKIIQIPNPDLMEVFKLPESKELNEDGTPIYYVNDLESQSTEGTISLIDTVGILTLSSFEYENELYHITTDFKSTYISNIQNEKFNVIDTVCSKSIWTYEPRVITTEKGHHITFFSNNDSKGLIDIWDNNIVVKMIE